MNLEDIRLPTSPEVPASPEALIRYYSQSVLEAENEVDQADGRAPGGVLRGKKGKLVEDMANHIILLAWKKAGGDLKRLTINKPRRSYPVHILPEYIERLPFEIQQRIRSRKKEYFYRTQVDKLIFVDDALVIGVECKAYTENAMLKRILVDFHLLKSLHPELVCSLLQLESQLGGDYANPPDSAPPSGSPSTHTLMSHFPSVDLNIVTLLDGERKVKRPIHKKEFFKEMRPARLKQGIERFSELLSRFT